MKLSDTPLRLVPNPFAAPLNAKGRAVALVEIDPEQSPTARYIGAKTKIAGVVARKGNPFGDKAKVEVTYDLAPRSYTDTGYHRAKVASHEVFEANAALDAKLVSAARKALNAFPGERSTALAAWRKQGLASVADAINPPAPVEAKAEVHVEGGTPGILPPPSDELRVRDPHNPSSSPSTDTAGDSQ